MSSVPVRKPLRSLLPRSVFGQVALVMALVLAGALLLALAAARVLVPQPGEGRLLDAVHRTATRMEAQARAMPRARAQAQWRSEGFEVRDIPPPPARQRPRIGALRWTGAAPRPARGGRLLRLAGADRGAGYVLWVGLATTPRAWVAFPLDGRAERVRRFGVALAAGSVLLVWLAAAWLARRIVQPLRTLARAAPALVAGEGQARVDDGPREVRELAQALNRASHDARAAAGDRALMLAGISHDLRTPLTRLQYALELVPGTDPALRDGMQRDIAEIDAILSQFIAYARDGRDQAAEALDLADTCRHALAAARQRWHVDLPDAAPLRGRPLALARAVENLVTNAERHGAAPFALMLSQGMDGAGWRIEVRDAGPGLSPEAATRARQPFVRDDASAGSGLGLAIVDRVAAQHGGALRLHANTPRGLRAVLELRGA